MFFRDQQSHFDEQREGFRKSYSEFAHYIVAVLELFEGHLQVQDILKMPRPILDAMVKEKEKSLKERKESMDKMLAEKN